MDRWRLLASLAIVPLVDAVVAVVAFPLLFPLRPELFAVSTGILGLLVMLCGGLPVAYWLFRRGPITLRQLLLAGLALGNVPFAIYAAAMAVFTVGHLAMGTLSDHLVPVSSLLAGSVRLIAIGCAMGLVSAVAFWFVAVHGTEATR